MKVKKYMSIARHKALLEKSISAAISAIEIYNKPDFKYREEAFSILMINAWELLLKAKILKDNGGNIKSVYVPDKKTSKSGIPLKRFYAKRNRTGNPTTIDIKGAISKIDMDNVLKENLLLLLEIRDNAIHFIVKAKYFEKKVLEIGTANLKSYVTMFHEWFDYDLSKFNFYLMPISFFHTFEVESFSMSKTSKQEKKLMEYIVAKETDHPSNEANLHNITLQLQTKFIKSSSDKALKVKYSDDAEIKVKIDEEKRFIQKYPLDNAELLEKMKGRFSDFVKNKKYYQIKRELEKDKKYSDIRYLDVIRKTGSQKRYYSTEIFKEFDKKYTKK